MCPSESSCSVGVEAGAARVTLAASHVGSLTSEEVISLFFLPPPFLCCFFFRLFSPLSYLRLSRREHRVISSPPLSPPAFAPPFRSRLHGPLRLFPPTWRFPPRWASASSPGKFLSFTTSAFSCRLFGSLFSAYFPLSRARPRYLIPLFVIFGSQPISYTRFLGPLVHPPFAGCPIHFRA